MSDSRKTNLELMFERLEIMRNIPEQLEQRNYIDKIDIMIMFDCGDATAYSIIKEIKNRSPNKANRGKVTIEEFELWKDVKSVSAKQNEKIRILLERKIKLNQKLNCLENQLIEILEINIEKEKE